MKLPRQELLKGCKDPLVMGRLINQAESTLRTWQSTWSDFVAAPLREEAIRKMAPLNNIHWVSDGGHPGAERQRLQCIRYDNEIPMLTEIAPIEGILIEGNFLFDRASTKDFRKSIEMIGIPAYELGDLWLSGDRGAQGLCTPKAATLLNGRISRVRDVQIRIEAIRKNELQLPIQRLKKRLKTVEASTRLDAIASAGFGLSRVKIVNQIKEGKVCINWEPIKQANKDLTPGDRIQLEGRGTLEVLSLDLTKRQRWRVELLRH